MALLTPCRAGTARRCPPSIAAVAWGRASLPSMAMHLAGPRAGSGAPPHAGRCSSAWRHARFPRPTAGLPLQNRCKPGGSMRPSISLGLPRTRSGRVWPRLSVHRRLASPVSLDAAERLHIARTLEHTAGNRRQAALILGISRSTLLHKIRKYGLDDRHGARRAPRTSMTVPMPCEQSRLTVRAYGRAGRRGGRRDRPPRATRFLRGQVAEGSLSFDGRANVGRLTGTTTTVSGEMSGGPALAAVRGWVESPVGTLKTGKTAATVTC